MALEIVSCFFDGYRKNGKEGENALKLVRENISNSIKSSSLGNNSLQPCFVKNQSAVQTQCNIHCN